MNELSITEYDNVRVLTTQQLAESYGTSTETITKNFNRNKERYVEGKHYICLKGEELREFKAKGQIDLLPNINTLYLWFEKGAFLHAKSLNTDSAWEVYDRLVETYFTAREKQIAMSELSPQLQMFYAIAEGQAKMELEQKRLAEEVEEVKQTQTTIAETFRQVNDVENFQNWANSCITKIAQSPYFHSGTATNMKYSMARSESYERLSRKRNCRLDDRVQRAKGRALEERPDIKKAELNKINKLYVIANDKDLRPAYELVIKEMMMCYCTNVKTA